MQASVLTLWDPERSQAAVNRGRLSAWGEFLEELRGAVTARKPLEGQGVRILTETLSSPTLAFQLQQFLKQNPQARWCQYDSSGRDQTREATRLAFGQDAHCYYRLDQADVIVALDVDLLYELPGSLRYARDFSRRRRLRDGQQTMNRLYVVESTPSITGSTADHRLALRPTEIEMFTRALAIALGVASATDADKVFAGSHQSWIQALVRDLQQHQGKSLVVAGPYQPPAVQALALAMNDKLANLGKTLITTEPLLPAAGAQEQSLGELVGEMQQGKVELLLILDGNPAYSAPGGLRFTEAMKKVPLRVHMGLYEDETSYFCHWHVPMVHYLEDWSDVRAFDGTLTLIQPLIAPLYEACRSPHELLAALTGQPEQSAHDVVKNYWKSRQQGAEFEAWWRKALQDGFVEGSAPAHKPLAVAMDASRLKAPKPSTGIEVCFRPDPALYDGRFANNGWLQELPKPWTKITWDNAALVSPATAERLGVSTEQLVEVIVGKERVKLPVFILPGMSNNAVSLSLGFGRQRVGKVGCGVGVDVGALRGAESAWLVRQAQVNKLPGHYPLARTQGHQRLSGRPLLRSASLAEYRQTPDFVKKEEHGAERRSGAGKHPGLADVEGHSPAPESLYPEFPYPGHAWAMVIDMSVCIGCNACVLGCQSENNIPVVGKDQVGRGREMLWLRVDQYFKGSPEDPEVYNQPVPCMHCEKAPCEVVCPVHATTHSPEGINEMTYNRCVGTRFCSNNCPYKVRRFNFYQYTDYGSETLKLRANPEVSVRQRGVMEKCTYCVQRINNAQIDAQRLGRTLKDGDVVTACQAACPTEAIVFGDLHAPDSRVASYFKLPLNYSMLAELNTQPRTTYLATVRNPNPELERR